MKNYCQTANAKTGDTVFLNIFQAEACFNKLPSANLLLKSVEISKLDQF